MITINSLFDCKLNTDTAVMVGKFDGLHTGHHLLSELIKNKNQELKSCVVTFVDSPKVVLDENFEGSLLTTEERCKIIENLGVDYLVLAPFDDRLKNTEAEEFVRLLCDNLSMKFMACGTDFRFGHMGKGDADLLREMSGMLGFELEVVEKLKTKDMDVSSTLIRSELKEGHIAYVNELLGYEYFIYGEIVHGMQLGSKIGIPTINMSTPNQKLIPKFGVYITEAVIDGKSYKAITNVGVKPTVTAENKPVIETHILDFDDDVYGRTAMIIFREFIREEMKFDSVEALKEQMMKDMQVAREYLG